MAETMLFRKNSIGLGTWRVRGIVTGPTTGEVLVSHSTVEGGAEIHHKDPIKTNGSGRNIQQQLDLEINSRISRQLDKGYKPDRETAKLGSTNQLGLVNPMLAQKIADARLTQQMFDEGAYVQYKYDGHRCLITKQGGDMLAYTRKGKPILTIPHVLEDAERWMQDGDTLDGELYIHGQKLQSISSLIKREQEGSKQLCYHWYDIVTKDKYDKRYKLMQDLYASCTQPKLVLVPTMRVYKMGEVYELFRQARSANYEGVMLRLSLTGYQDAVRASQLLKVKEREDCEVTAIGVRPSSQGWAIVRARMDNGKEFDISAPGNVGEKTEVLHNFETKYKNRRLTIEYAMLTNDGLPFHAVAMRWHEEL
jgi:DNA ligase-1